MTSGNYLSLSILGILACFLATTVARQAIVGGRRLYLREKLIHSVSLQYPENNHACGGDIIHNEFILTSAQCVVDHNAEFIPGQMYVRIRSNHLRQASQWTETIQVERIYVPREYNPRTYVGDIAVLKLRHAIRQSGTDSNNTIRSLKQPVNEHQDLVGQKAFIAGFGWNSVRPRTATSVIGTSDDHLHYSRSDVLSNRECERSYSRSIVVNATIHLCARAIRMNDVNRPAGVCNGDVGGLLLLRHADHEIAIGVLIRRSPMCDEQTHAAIYTRLSHYHEFIESVLAGHLTEDMRMHHVPQ